MLEAALAADFFGFGCHDSRCWYHVAPAATSNSAAESRPMRRAPDCPLVESFCLSFGRRWADAFPSSKSSADFDSRSSSENEASPQPIGRAAHSPQAVTASLAATAAGVTAGHYGFSALI